MRFTIPKLLLPLVVLAPTGCRDDGLVDLARAPDDASANRMIVHLPGFEAVSVAEKVANEREYLIRVPKERYYEALTRLHALKLLPRARTNWSDLLPRSVLDRLSADAESAGIDFARAYAAEEALLEIAPVRDARVLVGPLVEVEAAEEGERRWRSAAVVVVHDGSADEERLATDARRLVAGAVDGLGAGEDDVFVVVTRERTLPPPVTSVASGDREVAAAPPPASGVSDAADAPGEFRATVVAGGVSLLLLLQTLWILRGRRRARSARPAAPAPSAAS